VARLVRAIFVLLVTGRVNSQVERRSRNAVLFTASCLPAAGAACPPQAESCLSAEVLTQAWPARRRRNPACPPKS